MVKVYTCLPNGSGGADTSEFEWIHVYSGKPVPPTCDGSYNYLIWDLVRQQKPGHLFIGKFYPQSYETAKKHGVHGVYIDFVKRTRFLDRFKPIIADQLISQDRDFIDIACHVIAQSGRAKLLVWGAIDQLPYYRWAFPNKTIAYAHRWYEQPDPTWARNYHYCNYLLTLTGGATRRAFGQVYDLCPVVITIPNGVDLDAYRPIPPAEKQQLRSAIGVPQDKVIGIFPSALQRNKGTNYLLHWIKYCRRHLPEVYFLVTGDFKTSSLVGDVLETREVLEAGNNVRWLGRVHHDEMPRCYQISDFCLMPSVRPEGMSMASLEALASGLPLICTKHGAFLDYIFHEYNGLLCKPESLYSDGIEAIESMVRAPQLRAELSTNARAHAEKRLSRQRCLRNFQAFFEGRLEDIRADLSP